MRYFLATLAVLPLILLGCGPERVTLGLFDTSGSVDSDELRARYTGIIEQITTTLEPGDRLLGARITDRSDAEPLVLDEVLPKGSILDNEYHAEEALADARARAEAGAARILDATPSSCTDILGGLEAAARVLSSYESAERRLVLASDMVQTCPPLNLLDAELTEETSDAIIDAEAAAGRLPNLQGVDVWVAGAGTESRVDRDRRSKIENFWRAYLTAAGTHLPPNRYGPGLIDWD